MKKIKENHKNSFKHHRTNQRKSLNNCGKSQKIIAHQRQIKKLQKKIIENLENQRKSWKTIKIQKKTLKIIEKH